MTTTPQAALLISDLELRAIYEKHQLATADIVISDLRRILIDAQAAILAKLQATQAEPMPDIETENTLARCVTLTPNPVYSEWFPAKELPERMAAIRSGKLGVQTMPATPAFTVRSIRAPALALLATLPSPGSRGWPSYYAQAEVLALRKALGLPS